MQSKGQFRSVLPTDSKIEEKQIPRDTVFGTNGGIVAELQYLE